MTTQRNRQDRRSHIRVRDQILLQFRPVGEEEFKKILASFTNGTQSPWTDSAHLLGKGIQAHLRKIRERDEALANILETLDQKLTMILNILNLQEETESQADPQLVDLSATGLAFSNATSLPIEQLLELNIGLLPQRFLFRCYGKVTRCDQGPEGYGVAVNFVWITEDDQDKLIEHIFQRQVLQLRIRRHQRERFDRDEET